MAPGQSSIRNLRHLQEPGLLSTINLAQVLLESPRCRVSPVRVLLLRAQGVVNELLKELGHFISVLEYAFRSEIHDDRKLGSLFLKSSLKDKTHQNYAQRMYLKCSGSGVYCLEIVTTTKF